MAIDSTNIFIQKDTSLWLCENYKTFNLDSLSKKTKSDFEPALRKYKIRKHFTT